MLGRIYGTGVSYHPFVIPPKLLDDQIPDHGVLELLVEINTVIDIGQINRADDFFTFWSIVSG